MSQSDPKSVTGKRNKKARHQEQDPRAAEPMQAQDPVQKQAIDLHSGLQDLNRRTGELEAQVGELDAELKSAREALRASEARGSDLAAKAARATDLELELAALRIQLEKVQTWSAELSARSEQALASEKALREELEKTREQHVTVIRAKDEKVAALENRSKEGLKRLQVAHDAVLRDQAAKATAGEKAAREELAKLQELHESMLKEAAPLRSQVSDLRAQLEKAASPEFKERAEKAEARVESLHKDVDALSAQMGQMVGSRDKMRRELDEARSLLTHTREELKKTQELRDDSTRAAAALRTVVGDLERKLQEPPKEDPRIATLSADLKKAQDRVAELSKEDPRIATLKAQVADLERKASKEDPRIATLSADLKKAQDRVADLSKEDPRIATLKAQVADLERKAKDRAAGPDPDAAALKARAEKAEAQCAEVERYFASMEKALVEAQAEADLAAGLREQVAALKEECREHEEGLDQLSETVMELQHQLDEIADAKAAAPPPAAPAPEPPKIEVDLPAPVPPPPPAPAPSLEFPKPEPVKIELDFFDPPPPPKPAPAPVVVPASVTVPAPAAASTETTLRTNNTFGPEGPDGQPIYLLHEILPNDLKGVIYRATERATGRAFAVRFMAGQAGEEQTRAFEKEVEKLTGLPHPNILHVQGTGRRKNRLYVMMDLVDAPSLGAAKIQEIPRLVAVLRDAAGAVHYAHEEGIFHGDLNLETILVGKDGGQDLALVKDFGLAFMLETQTAGLRNPAFLPPEQVRVLKSPLSAAVDVYGLGATLFAALTGKAPFEGPDPAKIVKRVMIEEPPPVEKFRKDVPKAVSAVVRRAMAKERGVRYASAGEFADALTKVLDAGTK